MVLHNNYLGFYLINRWSIILRLSVNVTIVDDVSKYLVNVARPWPVTVTMQLMLGARTTSKYLVYVYATYRHRS
jgi:hypothetical protein